MDSLDAFMRKKNVETERKTMASLYIIIQMNRKYDVIYVQSKEKLSQNKKNTQQQQHQHHHQKK